MTNLVSPHQSIANAKPNFINLLNKTSALGERYNNGYGPEDARAEYFTQFSLLNLWLLLQFDSFLEEVFAPHSNKVTRYAQLTPQDAIQFMSQYDTINRASYCTKAMFDVEHFLNSVAKLLGIKARGYRDMTDKLINSLNLTNYQLDVLNFPARVRNTLHNNGYHTEPDFKMKIRGKEYKFEKDRQIMFSGWDKLYIIFDELLDVIEIIIESPQVKQFPKISHTSMTYHDTQ
jgi:hypothetical protein